MSFGRGVPLSMLIVAACFSFPATLPAQDASPTPASPATAPPTTAPSIPDLVVGTDVTGEIGAGDQVENRRRYDEYRIRLAPGDVVRIDMEALVARAGTPVLDSALLLYRDGGGRLLLAMNDNRAEGARNARLHLTGLREPVTYIVRAAGGATTEGQAEGGPGTVGPYRLSVTQLASATSQPPPIPLAADSIDGHLTAEGGVMVYRGNPLRQNVYTFSGSDGERVRIEMTSTAFASRLQLVAPTGRIIAVGGNEFEPTARITAILAQGNGEYQIRAQGPIDRTGQFALALTRLPRPAVQAPVRVLAGQSISDRLDQATSSAETDRSGTAGVVYFYRDYALRMARDEVVTVRLQSTDFDPVLEVGGMTMFGFSAFMQNDDAMEGDRPLNSRLVVRAPAGGVALIRARSLGTAVGSYELRVERGDTSAPPAPSSPAAE
jgi:hypothetical protein